ncbi:transmembrane protein 223-like [Gigantopelta aegis]|uniref:transmembrane protein 223-like n=1 Tax=Gigantopelta aegis TaxID=1735272 RepID=UPI001B887D22|nr:transmembrane protein 223-like [Gigantopelta aegis]
MIRFLPLVKHVCKQANIQSQSFQQCLSRQSIVFRRQATTKVKRSFEVDTNVKDDVLVYSYTSDRFYKLFTYCGVIQCLTLSYLGVSAYQLKDESKTVQQERLQSDQSGRLTWWAEKLMNVAEGKYKNGVSLLCFFIGYSFLTITIIYPLRSVRSLWLLRGGNEVHIQTQSWFGKSGSLNVPLNNVSCMQAREGSASYIPMKVKGKFLFFLIDKSGKFHNTQLFDYSIGLMRSLK